MNQFNQWNIEMKIIVISRLDTKDKIKRNKNRSLISNISCSIYRQTCERGWKALNSWRRAPRWRPLWAGSLCEFFPHLVWRVPLIQLEFPARALFFLNPIILLALSNSIPRPRLSRKKNNDIFSNITATRTSHRWYSSFIVITIKQDLYVLTDSDYD